MEVDVYELGMIEIFKRCELFLGLDTEEIQKIVDLPSCRIREYGDEEILFRPDDEASHLYVLVEGQVNLIIHMTADSPQPAKEIVWHTISRMNVFGWATLVYPYVRFGTAVSKGLSKIIDIDGSELRALFSEDNNIGYKVMNNLMKVIGSRVWDIERLLVTERDTLSCKKTKTD